MNKRTHSSSVHLSSGLIPGPSSHRLVASTKQKNRFTFSAIFLCDWTKALNSLPQPESTSYDGEFHQDALVQGRGLRSSWTKLHTPTLTLVISHGLPGKSISHHLSSRISRNSVQPCIESCHTPVNQMTRVTGTEELQGKPEVTD